MTHRFLSTWTLVLASLSGASSLAVAQTVSFGSDSPAVADSGTLAPAAKPAAKADSTPPEFKPSWNFSAWLFGTWSYQSDSATKAANHNNAYDKFTVDRAYLTFRGQVAPDWAFRVTTDVKTLPAGNAVYNGLVVRLKYAYMHWDYLHAAQPGDLSAWARIGQIHTVLIDDQERFWPRWLQKTPVEYWGIQPGSADLGAATQFTLPKKWGWAYFTVTNGAGYETAVDADRYKDAALRFSLTPLSNSSGLLKTFQITPWVGIGRTNGGVAAYPGLENNAGGLFVGNADQRLTFGAEYAERQVQTIPVATKVTTTASVYDAFVLVRPALFADPKGVPWGVVLRYDEFEANTAVSANRSLLLGGVFIDVAKASSVAITYQDEQGHSGNVAPTKTFWELNWQVTF